MIATLKWQHFWPILLGLGLAFLAALGIAIYVMQAPSSDLTDLIQFLLTSSLPSLVVGYLVFLLGRQRLRSIRSKILLAYSLGVVIAIFNIFVTSQLMFVSQHDFLLLGLLLIFAGLLSASFGYLLAASMTQSLRRLQAGAHQLAQGHFSVRVNLSENDELAEVANAFNSMADQLQQASARQQELEAARRNLIAAVSHDLRTPLASIRAMIEAMSDGVVTEPEMIQRYHQTIRTQTENLSHLINDLFELSKLESGQIQLQLEPISLNDLLSDVLESTQAQANRRGITLHADFSPNLPDVQAEFVKIQRVVYNLVQNAVRHTPAGGSITLATQASPVGVEVRISDTGDGISPDDLPHIFDQFFRGEKSRNRETGGAGLGLAIAKRIIEAHHGRIWANSRPGEGATFSFFLPGKPAPETETPTQFMSSSLATLR